MDEDVRTIWCGNIHEKVTEDLLYELFMQGGPVQKVSIPKDRDGKQKNFGFVTYKHECSVPYALDLFEGTSLFNRQLNMKTRNNSSVSSQYQQQQSQQQMIDYDNRRHISQNQLQLGRQILLGTASSLSFAPNAMYMMPGSVSYPSQNSVYMQGSHNYSDSKIRSSRQHNRSHPYRDHYNDRHDKHQDSYDRDNNRDSDRDNGRGHKSYKHSSNRSNHHGNRRKYR